MSTYPFESHDLTFNDDYSELLVQPHAGEDTHTFPLDTDLKAVQISCSDTGYTIEIVDRPSSKRMAFDIAKDPSLTFSGNRLGGNVIIDLRNISRYADPSKYNGRRDIKFELDGTSHIFWLTFGAKGLKLFMEDEYCHTIS